MFQPPTPIGPRLPAILSPATPGSPDETLWSDLEIRADFSGRRLSDIDASGCRIIGSRFTGGELDGARITDTVFEDCEFSGALISDLTAMRVELRRCRMSGLVSTGGHWKDVRVTDCKLDEANFRMSTWQRSIWQDCVLTGADFYAAALSDTSFIRCDLTGAEFSKAKLGGAHLHGSILHDLRGAECLRGVVIGSAQVVPLATAILAALGIEIDDEWDDSEPGDRG